LYKFIFEWPEVQTAPGKGNNRRQWISKYANHTIPLPPVHVQEKIVSILDTFTELTKELTKEQQARQTQYEYYRDKLLTFEDGEVEFKALKDITHPVSNINWEDDRSYKYIDLSSVCRDNNVILETTEVNRQTAPSR